MKKTLDFFSKIGSAFDFVPSCLHYWLAFSFQDFKRINFYDENVMKNLEDITHKRMSMLELFSNFHLVFKQIQAN